VGSEGGALAGAIIYGGFGHEEQGKGEGGKGKGKDMVRCANQSYIVRFAHSHWLSNVLKVVVRRRWLYLSGRNLYSRPYGQLNPCTRE